MSAAAISARLTPDTAAPVTGPVITSWSSDSSTSTCFEHESDEALKRISNTVNGRKARFNERNNFYNGLLYCYY